MSGKFLRRTSFRDRRVNELASNHVPTARQAQRARVECIGIPAFRFDPALEVYWPLDARWLVGSSSHRYRCSVWSTAHAHSRSVQIRVADLLTLLVEQFFVFFGGKAPALVKLGLQIDQLQKTR